MDIDFDNSYYLNTKYILIGSFIVIICVFIYLFNFRNESNIIDDYKSTVIEYDKFIVKESLIPNSGRGVFSNKDFKKGEIVEICPLISDKKENINKSIIKDYTFKNKFKDEEVIVFGLCSLYNHSDNNNIYHDQDGKGNMVYKAVRDIKKGEELYVNYGSNYWNSRNK